MTLPGPRPVLHDDKQAPDSAKWASSSNKPHAGGCSVRGNHRSPWLAQAAVRIIETHESEMAGCNKSFTSSCFVHFLNNNRTSPPHYHSLSFFFFVSFVFEIHYQPNALVWASRLAQQAKGGRETWNARKSEPVSPGHLRLPTLKDHTE